MAEPLLTIVLDYEFRTDGTQHIVCRGAFADGDPLPAEPTRAAGVERNVRNLVIGAAVGVPIQAGVFHVRDVGAWEAVK